MDDPQELADNVHWRRAIWALRAGYVGLLTTVAGLLALSRDATPWLLAVGVLIWLVCAGATVTEVLRCHRELVEPRIGLWPMRFMLLRDTLRRRPTTTEP